MRGLKEHGHHSAIAPHEANPFDMEQKYAALMTRDEALAAASQ